MLNSIETMGLRVERLSPQQYSTNVDVNSPISVEFNSDLNTGSIMGNFLLLKDYDRKINGIPSSIDISDFEVVKGSLTYKERTIFFTPLGQLEKSTRYIVYIPKGAIKDYLGRVSLVDYIAFFDTQGFATLSPCDVTYPTNNSVIEQLTRVELLDLNSEKYIVQISKNQDFENGLYDKVVSSNVVEDNFGIGDGSYYLRARATNGVFGETVFFTVKSAPQTLVSDEDAPFTYQPITDDVVELVDSFPKGINSSEKSNLVYARFDGIIPIEDIDFEECSLYGGLSDDNDAGNIVEHGNVDGRFIVVHDDENYSTYIMFIPGSL
jgi:hypothetical protein